MCHRTSFSEGNQIVPQLDFQRLMSGVHNMDGKPGLKLRGPVQAGAGFLIMLALEKFALDAIADF